MSVRASALPTIEDCTRRGATRMVRSLIVDAGYELLPDSSRGIASVIGTAVHAGAAHILDVKKETGEPGDLEIALQLAQAELSAAFEAEVEFDDVTPTRDEARIQVRRLLECHRRVLAPRVDPIAVEQELVAVMVIGGVEVELTGHVDLIEYRRVRDLKTGRSGRAHGSQLGGYSLLARSHGYPVDEILEDAIPRPRAKDVVEIYTTPYDVEACERQAVSVLRQIARSVIDFKQTLEPEAFLANPQSFACSAKLCPAYATSFCRIHRLEQEERDEGF